MLSPVGAEWWVQQQPNRKDELKDSRHRLSWFHQIDDRELLTLMDGPVKTTSRVSYRLLLPNRHATTATTARFHTIPHPSHQPQPSRLHPPKGKRPSSSYWPRRLILETLTGPAADPFSPATAVQVLAVLLTISSHCNLLAATSRSPIPQNRSRP